MNRADREYPLLHLPPGSTRPYRYDRRLDLVRGFEPLDFDPAHKAKAWLELNIRAGAVPFDTFLVFSEDESELFGFFALETLDVNVSPDDLPIMQVRQTITDPASPQHAVKLVWIARSRNSPKGFGEELFDRALVFAVEEEACALLVEPFDETTAQKLWLEHFELRQPRASEQAEDWSCLWHAVGQPDQLWP